LASDDAPLGFHPATIAKWLAAGGPPMPTVVPDEARVMTERWRPRMAQLFERHPRLLGVSVFNKLHAEGFAGSYPTVVREVRAISGPRFRAPGAVSVPILPDPGEEAQFDFCDLTNWPTGGAGGRRCSASVRSCAGPRQRLWWFTTSEDRHHTFEGLVRFFETSAVSRRRAAPTGWARSALHGAAGSVCTHRRWRSGRITAPRSRPAGPGTPSARARSSAGSATLQETFLPEVELDGPPASVDELNARATAWLAERARRCLAHDRRAAGAGTRGGATVPGAAAERADGRHPSRITVGDACSDPASSGSLGHRVGCSCRGS
jgi:hypothetical protein